MSTVPASTDILIVLHDLALGGTERVALRLGAAWAAAGRRVRLLCGDPRGPAAAWLSPGVEVVACAPPISRGLGSRARLARAAVAELVARPAGVLFVPGNFHWPLIAPVAALPSAQRPLIVAQVSNPLRRRDRGPFRRGLGLWRARRRLAGADVLVTLTGADTRDAEALTASWTVHHIPLPLLADDPPPARAPPGGPALALFLGRLVAQKRPDLALRAFVEGAVGDARLVFVGDGPQRPALMRSAARSGVGAQVEFAGDVADARSWLDRARVLVLPSDFEGYGAVVIEALAAGRPVVATERVPAAVEFIDRPERGSVVPAGDVAALSRALARMLSSDAPTTALQVEGLASFNLNAVAQSYLTLFDQGGSRPLA